MTFLKKLFAALPLICAGAMPVANAASPCVSTLAELQNNLTAWSSMSSGDMTIRLVQGTYALSLPGYYQSSGPATLSILGGYTSACQSRYVDPTNTTISGQNTWDFILYPMADVTLEGVTFTSLANQFVLSFDDTSDGHAFTVRYDIFRDFIYDTVPSAFNLAGIDIETNYSNTDIYFENNLVYNVNVAAGKNAHVLALYEGKNGFIAATSNTIVDNNQPSFLESDNTTGAVYLENNIIYNGTAAALDIYTDEVGPFATNNIIGPVIGTLSSNIGNVNANPLFVNAAARDYRIMTTSPAVNAGGASVALFGGYPAHDLSGPNSPRVVGSKIDIGAYESTFDDLNNFVVTQTSDNGNNASPIVGSLRWAIQKANANSGASKITFNLPCDANTQSLLTIATVLPDVTTDVTIDGYSNPNSTKNTSTTNFNAYLCVALNGSGNTAYALHTTGSGRLSASGMTFVGFTTAAILLEGGSGHVVTGNQFGGVFLAQPNAEAIRVTGSSGATQIGTFGDAGSVNLIMQCTDEGIDLNNASGGNVVAYNMLGVAADGSGSVPNSTGILVFDSPNNTVRWNWLDNSSTYGIEIVGLSKATSGNVVQNNDIGKTPAGIYGSNLSGGILIIGSYAHDNVIGASASSGSGVGNLIAQNGGPGVWVSTSGGVGNRIIANAIFGNTGLAIDLGAAGPTANDVATFDSDTGPNDLQNYPVLSRAYRTIDNHTLLLGALNSVGDASYRLDFYYGTNCVKIGANAPRGETDIYLGSAQVTTNLSGYASYSVSFADSAVELGNISATATAADGSTSEIGECLLEIPDRIFHGTFESGN